MTKRISTCPVCGSEFDLPIRGHKTYCSSPCSRTASNARRNARPAPSRKRPTSEWVVKTGTCINCGAQTVGKPGSGQAPRACGIACERRIRAQKMAEVYAAEPERWRGKTRATYERVCPTCGDTWTATNKRSLYCSDSCRPRTQRMRQAAKTKSQHGNAALAPDLVRAVNVDVRRLIAADDWDGVAKVLIDFTTATPSGCRLWLGSARDGYATVSAGRTPSLVHRLMITALEGGIAPPEYMPVHHACANRRCVSPAHLAVVTHHDNSAEMLERNHYQRRIAALEEALRAYDPDHVLLKDDGSAHYIERSLRLRVEAATC